MLAVVDLFDKFARTFLNSPLLTNLFKLLSFNLIVKVVPTPYSYLFVLKLNCSLWFINSPFCTNSKVPELEIVEGASLGFSCLIFVLLTVYSFSTTVWLLTKIFAVTNLSSLTSGYLKL